MVKNSAKLLLLGYRFPSLSESVPIPNFGIEYPVPESDSGRPTTDRFDICPIHQAAKKGHDKVIELLIDHGAYIDAKDKNQEIPLHHAARRGHPKVIDMLLKHGSDKELKNKDKETAIEVAQRFRLEKFNTDRQTDYAAVIALLDSTTM